jgi:biopolymer transport protein ExbB/TolQ
MKSEAIEAAERCSSRRAAAVRLEMRRGLTSLASIASVAPLFGLFGTAYGVADSFRGVDGERTAIMAALAQLLSESIAPVDLTVGLEARNWYGVRPSI